MFCHFKNHGQIIFLMGHDAVVLLKMDSLKIGTIIHEPQGEVLGKNKDCDSRYLSII